MEVMSQSHPKYQLHTWCMLYIYTYKTICFYAPQTELYSYVHMGSVAYSTSLGTRMYMYMCSYGSICVHSQKTVWRNVLRYHHS